MGESQLISKSKERQILLKNWAKTDRNKTMVHYIETNERFGVSIKTIKILSKGCDLELSCIWLIAYGSLVTQA